MILGIDIGGTNIKFGVVDEQFHIVHQTSIPTLAQRPGEEIVADIITVCREILVKYPYDRIGIGSPGDLDMKEGIILSCSNLAFRNTPIISMVRKALGMPAYLSKDSTCAVRAELYAGIGKSFRNLIMVTLGTGVGGGIIIGGKIYEGKDGGAGEVGHIIIQEDGLPCGCGQRGCLEKYASVNALIQQTQDAIAAHPESILARLGAEEVTGKTAFDAKEQGCPVGTQVVESYIRHIALGLKSLIRVLQPDAVVLSGAITKQEDNLLLPLREMTGLDTDIYISQLKNDAGVIGAAALTLEQ